MRNQKSIQTSITTKKIFGGIILVALSLFSNTGRAQDTTSIELVGQFGGFVSNVADEVTLQVGQQ